MKKREAPSDTFTFSQNTDRCRGDGRGAYSPVNNNHKTKRRPSSASWVEDGMQKKFNKESHARGKAIRVKIMMKILSPSLNPLTGARGWRIAVLM